MREETRQDIISAEEMGTKYDEAAKEIWKNREILAPLLKYSVEELKDESVESIMKLIDTDSISEDIPVSDRFAYLAAVDEYVRVEELPSGHGYADVVFIPKKGSAKPAMLIEIKCYLIVRITYNSRTKEHMLY